MTHELRKLRDNDEFLKWGCGIDDTLGDKIRVTIVATGFAQDPFDIIKKPEKRLRAAIIDGELVFNDEDEISEPIVIKTPDTIKIQIYDGKQNGSQPSSINYKNVQLSDPIIIPREKLFNEEELVTIENKPAIERRMTNNN